MKSNKFQKKMNTNGSINSDMAKKIDLVKISKLTTSLGRAMKFDHRMDFLISILDNISTLFSFDKATAYMLTNRAVKVVTSSLK